MVPVRPRQIDLTLGRRPFMLAPAATLMQIAAMRLARRRRRKRGSNPLRIAMLVSRLIQIEFSLARCCTRCRALLRDAICMYRGRGWPFPDAAIGPSRGASPLIGRRHFHDLRLAARPPSSQRQRSIDAAFPAAEATCTTTAAPRSSSSSENEAPPANRTGGLHAGLHNSRSLSRARTPGVAFP